MKKCIICGSTIGKLYLYRGRFIAKKLKRAGKKLNKKLDKTTNYRICTKCRHELGFTEKASHTYNYEK